MATVELRISPHSAQVRTARLLAVLLARRSGLDDSTIEEVRLAVGEACSRAVRVHQKQAPDELVRVEISDEPDFGVTVTDSGAFDGAVVGDLGDVPAAAAGGELVAGMSLALIGGLVEDTSVVADPAGGTRVRMCWPRAAQQGTAGA